MLAVVFSLCIGVRDFAGKDRQIIAFFGAWRVDSQDNRIKIQNCRGRGRRSIPGFVGLWKPYNLWTKTSAAQSGFERLFA
jgi:hypothetical protein